MERWDTLVFFTMSSELGKPVKKHERSEYCSEHLINFTLRHEVQEHWLEAATAKHIDLAVRSNSRSHTQSQPRPFAALSPLNQIPAIFEYP